MLVLGSALLAALASVLPAANVTPTTTAAYTGDHVHNGCTWSGCSFSASSTDCRAQWTSSYLLAPCAVTVSGWIPDNSDAITNATLTYSDAAGTFSVPVTYDGVTYRGTGSVRGGIAVVAGTITFSLPSGDLDPPPTRVMLDGGLQHAS